MGGVPFDYAPCSYANTRLQFRGPQRNPQGDYIAFLGGSETYGKCIAKPFPALVEARTGVRCVNLGYPNAGADVFLNEPGVLSMASGARLTILQVPCLQNMSNRFYSVHPRRNDRFVDASDALREIFSEVDFTEFHFVRHMLGRLQDLSVERMRPIREELRILWVSRMAQLIDQIEGDVALLWMSARRPEEKDDFLDVAQDPSLVTREMIEALRDKAAGVIEIVARDGARAAGRNGMFFNPLEAAAAQQLPGPDVHKTVADALAPLISNAALA